MSNERGIVCGEGDIGKCICKQEWKDRLKI